MRQVVARQHGERIFLAVLQGPYQVARGGLRLFRIRQIMLHARIVEVQTTGFRVVAIALLGYGQ